MQHAAIAPAEECDDYALDLDSDVGLIEGVDDTGELYFTGSPFLAKPDKPLDIVAALHEEAVEHGRATSVAYYAAKGTAWLHHEITVCEAEIVISERHADELAKFVELLGMPDDTIKRIHAQDEIRRCRKRARFFRNKIDTTLQKAMAAAHDLEKQQPRELGDEAIERAGLIPQSPVKRAKRSKSKPTGIASVDKSIETNAQRRRRLYEARMQAAQAEAA